MIELTAKEISSRGGKNRWSKIKAKQRSEIMKKVRSAGKQKKK